MNNWVCGAEQCRAAGVVPLARPLYDNLCNAARKGASATVTRQQEQMPGPDLSNGMDSSGERLPIISQTRRCPTSRSTSPQPACHHCQAEHPDIAFTPL